ncbi:EF-hand calcium-binding domain-containing protein 5 [Geranomyces variabilis]|uniref:EF-hand calcium-binding domain-containing protein 5 n=1 Tax=Geranomyces variabilis TaxID=109894 RepID=A0AAD5TIU0_9FUNG|nr:EF-hand calcium-binding domain-containing protein 5 [Geranomyces variabilis]
MSSADILPHTAPSLEPTTDDSQPTSAKASLPLEFTAAIDLQRLSQPRTSLDSEIRNAALSALADDFLAVPDMDLEMRAYMLETALPTLLFALEKLLREVERRKLVGGSEDPERQGGGQQLAKAADDGLEPQNDKPKDQFDSINWLAQFLYRNNPRFSNFSTSTSSPYAQSLTAASQSLKLRLSSLEAARRARVWADEAARRQDEDRAARVRSAQVAERHRSFEELLGAVFGKWVQRIWRGPAGYILQSELLDVYKQVFRTPALQNNPELMIKVDAFITAQTPAVRPETGGGDSASRASLLGSRDGAGLGSGRGAANNSVSSLNNAADEPRSSSNTPPSSSSAPSLSAKRYRADYVASHMILTESWTLEDLSAFLKELSAQLDVTSNDIDERYRAAFYVPRFPSASTRDDWYAGLSDALKDFVTSREDVDIEALRREWEKFLDGETKFVDAYRPKSAVTESDTGGDNRDVDDNDADEASMAEDTPVSEAERDYTRFTEHLVAEQGVAAAEVFMGYLAACLGRNEDASAQAAASAAQAAEATATERAAKVEGLYNAVLASRSATADGTIAFVDASVTRGVTDRAEKILSESSDADAAAAVTAIKALQAALPSWPDGRPLTRSEFSRLVVAGFGASISDGAFAAAVAAMTSSAAEPVPPPEQPLTTTAAVVDSTAQADEPAATATIDRSERERAAIAEIAALGSDPALTTAAACDDALRILTTTLAGFYANDVAFTGKISLLERENGVASLRCVAATATRLVGRSGETAGESFEARVVSAGVVKDQGGNVDGVDGDCVGVTLRGDDAVVGVLVLGLSGGQAKSIEDADVDFLQSALGALHSTLLRISLRENAMILAHAARRWAQSQCDGGTDVDVFLPERALSLDAAPGALFRLEDFVPPANDALDAAVVAASSWLRPRSSKLVRPETADLESATLQAASTSTTPIETTTADSRTTTYLPVADPGSGKVIAVLRVTPRPPATTLAAEDMDELTRTARVLGAAMAAVANEKLNGGEGFIADSITLDAESLDESTRSHLLFPKLLLQSARTALGKVDNKMLSELRSYRKPPATIHKVVKGVLYLFGKLPREVEKWADCCRMINMDLLKKMIDYDPTAVQKKVRFARVKRVLKSIPHGDVRKRGSIPAQTMSDWLVVSVDLREESLKRRKARARATATAESVEEQDDEEEEAEEEIAEGMDEQEEGDSDSRVGTAEREAEESADGEAKTNELTVSGGGTQAGEEEPDQRATVPDPSHAHEPDATPGEAASEAMVESDDTAPPENPA